MILNMTGGGTSNTKVINVASAAKLPASADVGTIAIISSTAVGKVTVSETQPSSPGSGDVWVTPGASGVIMIVSKGVPYAISVIKQYSGSAWTEVVCTQYMADGWMQLTVYLLDGADDCVSQSGGWKGVIANKATVTRNATNYYLAGYNNGAQQCELQSVNKVDMSPYSKLKAEVSFSTLGEYGDYFTFGVNKAANATPSWDTSTYLALQSISATGSQTVTVDVTSVKQSGIITFFTGGYLYVTKVWLEV